MEEECVAPKGSDNRFLEKLNKFCDKENPDAKYKSTRFGDGFILKHYAGDVEYSVDGWIEKNKDPLNEDITRLLAKSSQRHVAQLFEDYLNEDNGPATPTRTDTSFASMLKLKKGSGSFRTVGQRHKQQLLALMNTLYMTHPHFVRCILPNNRKRAGEIQTKLVLDQLRCNGVLEGIRICRKGFPNRLSFDEFRKRYQVLCPDLLDRNTFIDGRSACQMLVKEMNLDHDKYQIGTTKVFFKATVLAELEELRDAKLSVCITKFQAFCRGRMARQYQTRFSRQTEAIRVMQRNARLYVSLREWPWWKIYAKLKPLNGAYRMDTQMREKEQKISALESQLKDQNDTFNELMKRNQELESEQNDFKELILAEQQVMRELEETQSDLRSKVTSAEERIEELELELKEKTEAHKEDLDQLVTQVDTSKLVNDRLSGELERSKAEITQLHEQAEQNKAEITQLKEELEQANGKCVELNNENTLISERNKENEAKLHEQGTVQKDKIESLESENLSLQQKSQTQESEIEQLRKALQESQENERKLTEQNSQLTKDISQVQSQLASETTSKEAWESKYNHIKIDWDELTSVLRAEAEEAKARISKFDQVLSGLKFIQ